MTSRNLPCIVCGKPTARAFLVNYDNASGQVVGLSYRGPDSGLQPIGGDCKKKFPSAWVIDVRGAEPRTVAGSGDWTGPRTGAG